MGHGRCDCRALSSKRVLGAQGFLVIQRDSATGQFILAFITSSYSLFLGERGIK